MREVGLQRFNKLWQRLGSRRDMSSAFVELSEHYNESHRAYHNQNHIAHCLLEFDQTRHISKNDDIIELALWYHDAIYDPKSKNNEQSSADLLAGVIRLTEIKVSIAQFAECLILATKHDRLPQSVDEKIIVDVDLSILGQPSEIFERYEQQIKQEYSWVLEETFNEGRVNILNGFLKREKIYSTAFFQEKYEDQARKNIQRSIDLLM